MTDISKETTALGKVVGKYSGAAFMGTVDMVTCLVGRGAIRPGQGRAILLRLGGTAGGPEMATTMKLHAARFMTQRPTHRKR